MEIKLKPKGIPNIGNTCFANATLQALFCIPSMASEIRNLEDGKKSLNLPLKKLLKALEDDKDDKELRDCMKNIMKTARKQTKAFTKSRQHDACEFFHCIMNHTDNAISKLVRVETKTLFNCETNSSHEEPTSENSHHNLSVIIQGKIIKGQALKLDQLIYSQFFDKPENAGYECDLCEEKGKGSSTMLMKTDIVDYPEILVVQSLIYNMKGIRIDCTIEFREELTLKENLKGNLKGNVYRLVAIVVHWGHGIKSGHYVAYIKKEGRWWFVS